MAPAFRPHGGNKTLDEHTPAGRNRDILSPLDRKADGGPADTSASIERPNFLAGLRIQSEGGALDITPKNQVPCCSEQRGNIDVLGEMGPLDLPSHRIERVDVRRGSWRWLKNAVAGQPRFAFRDLHFLRGDCVADLKAGVVPPI